MEFSLLIRLKSLQMEMCSATIAVKAAVVVLVVVQLLVIVVVLVQYLLGKCLDLLKRLSY